MLTSKFTRAVAILLLIIEAAAIVMTFVGAVTGGADSGLFITGVFLFVAAAAFGWLLIAVYNRVHKDEEETNKLLLEAEKKARESEDRKETEE
jgi:positive regulator of sigma E activity